MGEVGGGGSGLACCPGLVAFGAGFLALSAGLTPRPGGWDAGPRHGGLAPGLGHFMILTHIYT